MFGTRSVISGKPGGGGNWLDQVRQSRSTSVTSRVVEDRRDRADPDGGRRAQLAAPRVERIRVAAGGVVEGIEERSRPTWRAILARLGARLVTRRREPRDDLAQVVGAARLEHELDLGLRRRRARERAARGAPGRRWRRSRRSPRRSPRADPARRARAPAAAPAARCARARARSRARAPACRCSRRRSRRPRACAENARGLREHRRERGGARALGHRLLDLEQQQDRRLERVLLDEEDLASRARARSAA